MLSSVRAPTDSRQTSSVVFPTCKLACCLLLSIRRCAVVLCVGRCCFRPTAWVTTGSRGVAWQFQSPYSIPPHRALNSASEPVACHPNSSISETWPDSSKLSHSVSFSRASFSATFFALSVLSSLNVVNTQNHAETSMKPHVNMKLLFRLAPACILKSMPLGANMPPSLKT